MLYPVLRNEGTTLWNVKKCIFVIYDVKAFLYFQRHRNDKRVRGGGGDRFQRVVLPIIGIRFCGTLNVCKCWRSSEILAFLHDIGNMHNTVSKSQSLSIKVRT